MPDPSSFDTDALARFETADVIFVAQDGFRQPSARVRCYNFARALRQQGLRAEVLSFFDHLGATDQCGPLSTIAEEEKLRLNLQAHGILARNPRAVLYMQKVGYHALAVGLAAARDGNPVILDYDDYELDMQPFRRLEPWLPSLRPGELLGTMANRAVACVAASHRLYDILAPLNPNTHLIHTVADQEQFSPAGREAPRQRFGSFVNILYSGDFWGDIPMKDVLFALDAFALVPRRTRERARFHIIGFGRAWEELKARIRERFPDLPEIVLHEFIPPTEFGAVLREMDIGVLPYSANAFNAAKSPTKMFEYILAKVAVCATPVGEAVHCLTPDVHGLFASDIEEYAGSLARLIADDAHRNRLAEAAYALALERYSLQGIAGRLATVVRDALRPATAVGPGVTLERHLTVALGRTRPVAPREVHLVREDLRALLALEDPTAADPRRWSAPLLAALDWPGLPSVDGVPAERVQALKAAGARCRNAARLRPTVRLPAAPRPPGPPALSKLAAAEDWEDERWWSWAVRFRTNVSSFRMPYAGNEDTARLNDEDTRNNVCNFFKRSHGTWERVQILYALDWLGLLDGATRLLVASRDIDGLPLLLSELAAHVDVVDVGERAAEHAARVAAGEREPWLAKPRRFRRERLAFHHDGPDRPSGPFDAVVMVQNVALWRGLARTLAWTDRNLAMGGIAAFSTAVRLDDSGGDAVPGLTAAVAPAFADRLAAHTGFVVLGPVDLSLSDATLDRFVETGGPAAANPFLVARTAGTLHTCAVWVCRKTTETPSDGWERLGRSLVE